MFSTHAGCSFQQQNGNEISQIFVKITDSSRRLLEFALKIAFKKKSHRQSPK